MEGNVCDPFIVGLMAACCSAPAELSCDYRIGRAGPCCPRAFKNRCPISGQLFGTASSIGQVIHLHLDPMVKQENCELTEGTKGTFWLALLFHYHSIGLGAGEDAANITGV